MNTLSTLNTEPTELRLSISATFPQPSKPNNLHYESRQNCWYFRMKMPVRYKGIDTREKIRISLGTDDLHVAILKAETTRERVIQDLENRLNKTPAASIVTQVVSEHRLHDCHRPLIVHNYKCSELQKDFDLRANMSDEDYDLYVESQAEALKKTERAIARRKVEDFESLTRTALATEKIVAVNNNVFSSLIADISAAELEVRQTIAKRNEGKVPPTPSLQSFPARDIPTMRDAYEAWSATQSNEQTKATYLQFVRRFETHMGAMPLAAISSQIIDAFAEILANEGLSLRTMENYLSGFKVMVKKLKKKIRAKFLPDTLEKNLLDGWLDEADTPVNRAQICGLFDGNSDDKRRPFEKEEAQLILDYTANALNTPSARPVDVSFAWFVRLGLFCGARLEEIAQLRVDEVEFFEGTPFIKITDSENGQKLKNSSSKRRVPLHTSLIARGFLGFVEMQRQNGCELIFSEIVGHTMFDRLGAAIGKRFARMLEKLNLKDGRLCFHSCRYNVNQALQFGGVQQRVIDALIGHWRKDKSDCYDSNGNGDFALEALKNGVAMAKFYYNP